MSTSVSSSYDRGVRSASTRPETEYLGEMLDAAMARSSQLVLAAKHHRKEARYGRLQSRPHLLFARLEGEVNGHTVGAVVRTDSSIAADARLLEQARIVAALGDTFDDGRIIASLSSGPLIATLTLIRACDRVMAMEVNVAPSSLSAS